MKKKLITFFLLLILSTQVLPIQQIGSIFFSNLFTEEIPHNSDLEKDDIKKAALKNDFLSHPTDAVLNDCSDAQFLYLVSSDIIPKNHSAAIDVPPPNCFL